MIKVITAIGNEELNNKLKQNNIIEIKNTDVQYQEGIFEILEENKDIDIIIINEKIIGELRVEELLKKIIMIKPDIKIILIINSKNNIIKNKNIVKIINNEKNYINEILNYFGIENSNEKNYRSLYSDKNEKEINIVQNNEVINNKKKKKIKEKMSNQIKKGKIIIFIGPAGIGKTTMIAIISKLINNRKILIIDFNLVNNNLHTIFGIKKYKKIFNKRKYNLNKNHIEKTEFKKEDIKKIIIKINNKIDLISDIKNIFYKNEKINFESIENIITDFKYEYDLILIDTTTEIKYQEVTQKLIKLSNIIICLTEGNLIQIKKTKELLNKFMDEKIKINIILNKKDKYAINKNLLNGIFNKNKIIGEIKYDENYTKIINKNMRKIFITKKIKKEIAEIIKKIDI